MSRNHGYMIYDTLFGTDEKSQIKPQMVERGRRARTSRLWTFKLRDGLEFHDGKPVTARGRGRFAHALGQARRDGQTLMTFVEDGYADAEYVPHLPARALRLRARGARQALVQRAVHHAEARRRDRRQQADRGLHRLRPVHVRARTNSSRATRRSTSRTRSTCRASEPPSGTAGGKIVKVDRVEWILALRDPQTAVNALQKRRDRLHRAAGASTYSGQSRRTPNLQIAEVPTRSASSTGALQPSAQAVRQPEGARRRVLAAFKQEPS